MDAKSYCDSLLIELTGWKAKTYDVVRKLDKMSSGDKQKVVPQVNELHMILENLEDRVHKLRTECPVQWEPDKIALESKLTHAKKNGRRFGRTCPRLMLEGNAWSQGKTHGQNSCAELELYFILHLFCPS